MNTRTKNILHGITMGALCLFSGISHAGVSITSLTLTDANRSEYEIVLPKTAIASEQWAAKELQEYIRRMSGVFLPIVEQEESDKSKPAIWIGSSPDMTTNISALAGHVFGPEEFKILQNGNDLVIAGGRPRGVMYGVYELLETVWGCHWLAPDCEVVPSRKVLTLPMDFALSGKPALEYRDVLFKEAFDSLWAVRNRVPGAAYEFKDELNNKGGRYEIWPLGHGIDSIVPFKKYHASNPRLFGQKPEGGIEYRANCYSNPELHKLAKQKIKEWLKTHPDATVYDISQKDGSPDGCHCPECQTLIDAEGTQVAPIITMANRLATEMKHELGGKYLTVLAYNYTVPAPKILSAQSDVVVRLCLNPHLKLPAEEPYDSDNLRRWIEHSDHLWIWLYCNDYVNTWMPYPNIKSFAEHIKYLSHLGVKGIMAQGLVRGGGDMIHLKAWVWAKIMWHPSADVDALIATFLDGYYGKSANAIQQYVDLMETAARRPDTPSDSPSYWKKPYRKFMDSDTLLKAYDYLCEAEALADNETIKKRVRIASLCVRFSRMINGISPRAILANGKYGFEMTAEAKKESKIWFKDAKGFGFDCCSEFTPMEVLETAISLATEKHHAITLRNDIVEVILVPELGGRIVSLKELPYGENLIHIGAISRKTPFDMGINETFGRHATTMLGDKAVYTVSRQTESEVILSATLSNGEIITKTISLAEHQSEVRVDIDIQNPTEKDIPMQRLHIQLYPSQNTNATREIRYYDEKDEPCTFTTENFKSVAGSKKLLLSRKHALVQSTGGWIIQNTGRKSLHLKPVGEGLDMTVIFDGSLKFMRVGLGGWIVPANGGKIKQSYLLDIL